MHALIENAIYLTFYSALLCLAIVCVIAANNLNKDSRNCQKSILVAKLIACLFLWLGTYYNLHELWLIVAIIPLAFGASFDLIESLRIKNIHIIVEFKKLTRLELIGMFIKTFKHGKGNTSARHRH